MRHNNTTNQTNQADTKTTTTIQTCEVCRTKYISSPSLYISKKKLTDVIPTIFIELELTRIVFLVEFSQPHLCWIYTVCSCHVLKHNIFLPSVFFKNLVNLTYFLRFMFLDTRNQLLLVKLMGCCFR